MKLFELISESTVRLRETVEDDETIHQIAGAIRRSIRATPEWLEYFHPDGTRVNLDLGDGEIYNFETDKDNARRYYSLYLPGSLSTTYGTIGEITGLQSKTDIGKYLLGVNFAVTTDPGFLENVGYGGWFKKSKKIVVTPVALFKGAAIDHELRHVVDDYYSGGKHYPESHQSMKWGDRPGELSAEYATAVWWLKGYIFKSIKSGKELDNVLLKKIIEYSIQSMRIPKLKDKNSTEYKRVFSRLYKYASSLRDENYSPSDRFSISE